MTIWFDWGSGEQFNGEGDSAGQQEVNQHSGLATPISCLGVNLTMIAV